MLYINILQPKLVVILKTRHYIKKQESLFYIL